MVKNPGNKKPAIIKCLVIWPQHDNETLPGTWITYNGRLTRIHVEHGQDNVADAGGTYVWT